MSCRLCWFCVFFVLELAAAARCGQAAQQLRLRSSANELTEADPPDLQQLDLSQLSKPQLQQLMQQLQLQLPLQDDYLEDNRGSSKPWKKVQRIIRRQLVRIPKRYLKKLLRQFGLARSAASVPASYVRNLPEPQQQEYYLIPLD